MDKIVIQQMLEEAGLTGDLLLQVLENNYTGSLHSYTSFQAQDAPTYGILIGLFYFAANIASQVHRKPNRVLKQLVDTLFPQYTITRADRLERKIKSLCLPLDSMVELGTTREYLQTHWIPQPTGI